MIDAEYYPSHTQRVDAWWGVTITGEHDIFRFCVNMLSMQVEFCEAGSKALKQLRKDMGADKFDAMACRLLDPARAHRLATYWTAEVCECGHDREEHWGGEGHCLRYWADGDSHCAEFTLGEEATDDDTAA